MTKRCPITYEKIGENQRYSDSGLRRLSKNLKQLNPLPFTWNELLIEAAKRASKMSIQGVQPKLSATLDVKNGCFDVVESHGHYILKPPLPQYREVPENEDVTMRMASLSGIEVPLHGLVYNQDETLTYFIKRFDRIGAKRKRQIEDFAQLTQSRREVKYRSSMEEIVRCIDSHCTFPMVEKRKMLLLTLFNFLVGNEDMHLKNFSVITTENTVKLSPGYDLLNTTIILGDVKEELALPLNGKKNNLRRRDFIEYFAKDRMKLNATVINEVLQCLVDSIPKWFELLEWSFLSDEMKSKYHKHLMARLERLELK